MTDYAAVLRELMLAGYEGAPLLAAFDRLCAAIGGSNLHIVQSASPKVARPANDSRVVTAVAPRIVPAAVPVTVPPENAKAVARKAIAQSMLSPSTIALASHLIERFNLTTGRCDPGSGSLADDLGISVRQVRRSIASLVASGLFGKARHGGRVFANAYQPNWPLIVERAAEGDIAKRPMLSAGAANAVTQNHRTKPDSDSIMARAQRRRATRVPDRRQVEMMMPIGGGREKSEEAVRSKLFGQLEAHLRATFLPSDKAGFAEGLTRSMEIGTSWQAAIKAEMHKHGNGLPVLLQALDVLGNVRMGLGGSGR